MKHPVLDRHALGNRNDRGWRGGLSVANQSGDENEASGDERGFHWGVYGITFQERTIKEGYNGVGAFVNTDLIGGTPRK